MLKSKYEQSGKNHPRWESSANMKEFLQFRNIKFNGHCCCSIYHLFFLKKNFGFVSKHSKIDINIVDPLLYMMINLIVIICLQN